MNTYNAHEVDNSCPKTTVNEYIPVRNETKPFMIEYLRCFNYQKASPSEYFEYSKFPYR
jgi:hypothetical protein